MAPEADRAVAARKQALRGELLAARRARTAEQRAAAAAANADHLRALVRGRAVICGYLPLSSEPMTSLLWDEWIADGIEVLLPIAAPQAPLDWVRYGGPTAVRPVNFGIAEPIGPRLGPHALRKAEMIVLPALAVDRAGRRLGRGGGHYDRSLALLDSCNGRGAERPELVAVLFDDELLARVPADVHDRPVTAVVAPAAGVLRPARSGA